MLKKCESANNYKKKRVHSFEAPSLTYYLLVIYEVILLL